MTPHPDEDNFAQSAAEPPASPPPTRGQALAPTLAVMAVVIAALAAAAMTRHTESPAAHAVAAAEPVRPTPQKAAPPVVTAPPLNAMGAAPGCGTCGTVESVAAADSPNRNYRMRIRMDDGSLRTVEQRGALPAGSRVVVDAAAVRLMPGNG